MCESWLHTFLTGGGVPMLLCCSLCLFACSTLDIMSLFDNVVGGVDVSLRLSLSALRNSSSTSWILCARAKGDSLSS